jgi:hypothetical protein
MLLVEGTILGILVGGMYALMASGLTLIFGVMRLINIGHAAIVIFASYLSWAMFIGLGIDPLLSIGILMVVFFVAGALLQMGILSALVDKDLSLALLATLGVANVLEGVEGAFWTSSFHAIHTSARPPTSIRPGIFSSHTTASVISARTTIAPAAPHRMAFFCNSGGRLRAASAMRMALSPASTRSITMIEASAAANCMVKRSDNHSMVAPKSNKETRLTGSHGRQGRDALQTMNPVAKVLLDTSRLGTCRCRHDRKPALRPDDRAWG